MHRPLLTNCAPQHPLNRPQQRPALLDALLAQLAQPQVDLRAAAADQAYCQRM